MNRALRLKLTIRLYAGEDLRCFGPGVATLLRRVQEHRSLRAAAASMEMAYSKAWRIIRTAEEVFGCKLLVSSTGGVHGGGAVPTRPTLPTSLPMHRRVSMRPSAFLLPIPHRRPDALHTNGIQRQRLAVLLTINAGPRTIGPGPILMKGRESISSRSWNCSRCCSHSRSRCYCRSSTR